MSVGRVFSEPFTIRDRLHRWIDWEAAKMRGLSVLRQRLIHGEEGLSNAEIRQITRLDRYQVVRLMKELQREEPAVIREGAGKDTR